MPLLHDALTTSALSTSASDALHARWQSLRSTRPELRIRDAAAALGTTELELLATTVGATARWLDGDARALLHGLCGVGRCMALTRSEHAVSEVRGRYGGVELAPHAGQVVGEHVDLRVFLDHWRHAIAVDEPDPKHGELRRRVLTRAMRTAAASTSSTPAAPRSTRSTSSTTAATWPRGRR